MDILALTPPWAGAGLSFVFCFFLFLLTLRYLLVILSLSPPLGMLGACTDLGFYFGLQYPAEGQMDLD